MGKKGKPYHGEASMRALTMGERNATGLGNLLITSTPRGAVLFWRRGTKGGIKRIPVSWEIRRALKNYWG